MSDPSKPMSSPFEVLLKENQAHDAHKAEIRLTDTSGKYRIGEAERPRIKHDGGFIEREGRHQPTAADHAARAAAVTLLNGSESLNTKHLGSFTTFGDFEDANAAYRHFLYGNGKKREINYERYLVGDPEGAHVIPNLMKDFKHHIEIIGQHREQFSVTSEAFVVGNSVDAIALYPETQNWRKALGAHFLWLSAIVHVSVKSGRLHYQAQVTINMEDMYNFNPGDTDMNTPIKDAFNGALETSGLAQQYLNYGTISRIVNWDAGSNNEPTVSASPLANMAPRKQPRH